MRIKKSKRKKFPKFRLLLDSAFAKPSVFKRLCKKAYLKHIRSDFNLAPATADEEIYEIASQKRMFVITFDHGFRKLVRQNAAGILILSSGLSNKQIDDVVTNFISGKNPDDFLGKATKI